MAKSTATSLVEEIKRPIHLRSGNLFSHFCFGSYVFLPILAAIIWLTGLLTMLAIWVSAGRPRYTSDTARVAFISDVGAANETLFLSICVVVILLYFSSVCVTRWLRSRGRLPEDVGKKEKVFGWLAIFFCGVGCSGLFVLAKWNCFDYPTVHWFGTLIFIVGVAMSAVFQTLEVWSLGKGHKNRKHLKRNSYPKLACVGGDIILAIGFAVAYLYCGGKAADVKGHTYSQCDDVTSKAAVLEWTIAFGLNIYFLTIAADLWPAGKSSERFKEKVKTWEMEQGVEPKREVKEVRREYV
ncbi:hypothetical protein IAT38_001580 [Cryptococcus sp. DSM 104549]